ncbi:MAG: C4-type zinc ribbon domain-containing protein [Candidatus Eisenbacteria bacterium]|jgi:hypothetical protein|nr:C4-type zinc ribbon domain-containing protein [Candidatus Eisenbacteria bacterium]
MDETIERLLKLQEIDTLIAELEKKRALVPKRLAEQQADLDTAVAALTDGRDKHRQRELEKRAAEKEVDEIGQIVLRYQSQLNTAKTNEEYRALLGQIERSRLRQAQAEDRVLGAMVEIEHLDRVLCASEEAQKAAQKRLGERERELHALAARLDESIQIKGGERAQVAATIDQTVLRRYERILAGKGGLAVAVVAGYVCGGCHGTLPPQTVNEIRKRDKLHTCQFCGRIIVTLS